MGGVFQALVILRCCTKCPSGYIAGLKETGSVKPSGHEQKILLEAFIDEVLLWNTRWVVLREGPFIYKEEYAVEEEGEGEK